MKTNIISVEIPDGGPAAIKQLSYMLASVLSEGKTQEECLEIHRQVNDLVANTRKVST